MCKYCEESKPLQAVAVNDKPVASFQEYRIIQDKILVFHGEHFKDRLVANFCPICGKALNN